MLILCCRVGYVKTLLKDGNAHFMLYSTVGYVKTLLKDGNAHFMLESRLREDIVKGWQCNIYTKSVSIRTYTQHCSAKLNEHEIFDPFWGKQA